MSDVTCCSTANSTAPPSNTEHPTINVVHTATPTSVGRGLAEAPISVGRGSGKRQSRAGDGREGIAKSADHLLPQKCYVRQAEDYALFECDDEDVHFPL